MDSYHKLIDSQKEKYKSAWPDFTSPFKKQELLTYKKLLRELSEVDKTTFNTQELINIELLELILQDNIDNRVYRAELFPLSAEGGFIISMIYSIQGKNLNDEESINQYELLLADTPRYINQQIALMRTGLTLSLIHI